MAVTADQVVVELVARLDKYEANMRRAEQNTARSFNNIGRSAVGAQQTISRAAGLIRSAFLAFGAGVGLRGLVDLTSAWSDLTSRVDLAAGSTERGAAVMDRLQVIARRTYSSLNQTAESWLQNTTALRELGYSTQQQIDLTETLNNAIVISGVRGDRARSVMEAWSKAMALGELRGENLNTVIQSGGRLAEALAKSMGVSTNELRRLGAEGKITTNDLFGVTSQMEQLRQEADDMPVTVADGFQALSDAIWVFIGNADSASGAGEALGSALKDLAEAINSIPENWFEDKLGGLGEFISTELERAGEDFENLKAEIRAIGDAFEYLRDTKLTDALSDLFDNITGEAALRAQRDIFAIEEAFSGLLFIIEQESAGAGDTLVDELNKVWEELIRDQGAAEDAQDAIAAMIGRYPSAAPLLGELLAIARTLAEVRGEADAAASSLSNIQSMREEMQVIRNLPPAIDLDDDGGPIITPTRPTRSGSKRSPAEQFADALEAQRRRTELLQQETALQATLNPLIDDYGFAMAKLRAQQELENAAMKAGLELTPERIAQIEELANGYALATAESERLADAQGVLKEAFDDLQSAGRQALDTIIDGFLEGKDAGEIFNSVLKDLAKSLISIGLNSISGGFKAGGFNPLGWLFGAFDKGGYTGHGGKHEPAGVVHKGEFVFSKEATRRAGVANLQALHSSMKGYASGGYVGGFSPPQAPSSGGSERAVIDIRFSVDGEGNIIPLVRQVAGTEADIRVAQAAPAIVGASVGQANKTAPAAVAGYQRQRGGADWRNM